MGIINEDFKNMLRENLKFNLLPQYKFTDYLGINESENHITIIFNYTDNRLSKIDTSTSIIDFDIFLNNENIIEIQESLNAKNIYEILTHSEHNAIVQRELNNDDVNYFSKLCSKVLDGDKNNKNNFMIKTDGLISKNVTGIHIHDIVYCINTLLSFRMAALIYAIDH